MSAAGSLAASRQPECGNLFESALRNGMLVSRTRNSSAANTVTRISVCARLKAGAKATLYSLPVALAIVCMFDTLPKTPPAATKPCYRNTLLATCLAPPCHAYAAPYSASNCRSGRRRASLADHAGALSNCASACASPGLDFIVLTHALNWATLQGPCCAPLGSV